MKRISLIAVSFALLLAASASATTQFLGAQAVRDGHPVPYQKKATAVSPSPALAKNDRGAIYADDCFLSGNATESPECAYGDITSSKTVVLFGDSKAAHFFPALEQIALERSLRLVVLTRGKCSFAEIPLGTKCDKWRQNSLQRIESIHPEGVVVSSSTAYFRSLGGIKSVQPLARISTSTIRRLKSASDHVVFMRNQSLTPYRSGRSPADCVKQNMQRLQRCAWVPGERKGHEYDWIAAKRVGVQIIDTESRFCRRAICPMVVGNVITYRDGQHYTATFSRSMAPWLSQKLPSF